MRECRFFGNCRKVDNNFPEEEVCRLNAFETVRVFFNDLIFESKSIVESQAWLLHPKVRTHDASAIVSFRSFSNQTAAKSMTTDRGWTR
jgi:hypothetical protein